MNEFFAKTNKYGKPAKTVTEHAVQTAEVARNLIDLMPESFKEAVSNIGLILSAIHDVGKISPGFQLKILGSRFNEFFPDKMSDSWCTDHTGTGAAAIDGYLGARFGPTSPAWVVEMHHGAIRKRRMGLNDDGGIYGGPAWQEARRNFIKEMESRFGMLANEKVADEVKRMLVGLVTTADWIASDESFFTDASLPVEEEARNAVEQCGFFKPEFQLDLTFTDIFDGKQPYDVQQCFIDAVTQPGLYILEAPMGCGKTEAALYAAYQLMSAGHHHGFYFGLPTRLTSDRIHQRVQSFLKNICNNADTVKLAHGTAWLTAFMKADSRFSDGHDGETPEALWFNPSKRMLLYPFAVGTIDQALLGVINVKHNYLRMFGLAGKIVILDEVHSYDLYTGTLLDQLVKRLLAVYCTVIILSATLTGQRRNKFLSGAPDKSIENSYPLITSQASDEFFMQTLSEGKARSYNTHMVDWDNQETAAEAVSRAENNECVLCIANTVAKAQHWFDAVKQQMSQDAFPVGLIHSKFPQYRRTEIEDEWMKRLGKKGPRPKGCVLVATQVVEQSVDIDADVLITELAPTDMLLQRMGRQWRHEIAGREIAQPETFIVSGNPLEADSAESILNALGKANTYVYSAYVLYRTYQVWHKETAVNLPGDIRRLLEATYRDALTDEGDAVCELRKRHERRCEKLKAYAAAMDDAVTGLPTGTDGERAATRYSEIPTVPVVLAQSFVSSGRKAAITLLDGTNVEADADVRNKWVTAQLLNNKVDVALHQLGVKNLKNAPFCLKKHFFEPALILIWDAVTGHLKWPDGRETLFTYTHARGLGRIRTETQTSDRDWTYSDTEDWIEEW